jgi:hypothetical protein
MSNNQWSTAIHDVQARKHQRTVSEHNEERKRLLAIIEEQSLQVEAALAITGSQPTVTKIKPDKSMDGEATAFAIASDWHVEETVEGKTVNGLNEFNLDIAERRIERFFKNVVRMTDIQRAGAKIDRLVLFLGGDLMTGYIHEELVESNGLSPTETVLWLQDRVASGVDFLGKHFSEIVIPCTYGNHGRTTLKSRVSTGAKNSYEWMLYHVLKKQLGHKADWHVADGYHLYLDCYGRSVRFHHGDGLKYQGGIGGLTIPVEKAIASWNKGVTADLDVFGHWHQSQQNPKWISNGCLIGYGPYALSIKAPFEKPSQTYFLMDKKHGRTVTAPIFLD